MATRLLASTLFAPTLREVPRDAVAASHKLMLRAGFIRPSSAGVYSLLPLAVRVLDKVTHIVNSEMVLWGFGSPLTIHEGPHWSTAPCTTSANTG